MSVACFGAEPDAAADPRQLPAYHIALWRGRPSWVVRRRKGMTADASPGSPWWHVIWVTCRCWSPTDQRGDWRGLASLYADLAESGAAVELCQPLPRRWQSRPVPEGAVELPPAALGVGAGALGELASSDWVAGGTPIAALAVRPRAVQLLLGCPTAALHQRVGRLKSRAATLLAFAPELGVGGTGTWCKGFWWARLSGDAAVNAVAAFIAESGGAEQAAAADRPRD